LRHIAGSNAAEEANLYRDGAVLRLRGQHRTQKRRLAVSPRAIDSTVPRIQRAISQQTQLIRAVG
jgi:hypothetical protein